MLRRLSSSVSIAALLLLLPAAECASQEEFAGTWEAKLKGAVICTLKLKADETITGSMYGCNIHVNGDGDLIESEPPDQGDDDPSPILNPRLQGDTLAFESRDPEDESPLKFELRLTGRSRADLTFIDAPVRVKPIRFERK